jgi:hypothetical protein
VVVWERDVESGKIGGKLVARKLEGPVVFVGWDGL